MGRIRLRVETLFGTKLGSLDPENLDSRAAGVIHPSRSANSKPNIANWLI